MIDFLSLRGTLESSAPVLTKFAAGGDFSITAGEFAEKVAPALGLQKEAAALMKAIGPDPDLFRFRKREGGSDLVPFAVAPGVFLDGEEAVARLADLTPLEGEFIAHSFGPGAYAVLKVGTAQLKIQLQISDEFRHALDNCRDDGVEYPLFEETAGAPVDELASPYDSEPLTTLRYVPQLDLPPHADNVPRMVDLEVVAVLAPSRKFKSPRITVKLEDGSTIVGLICTQPMVRALTGQEKGDVELTDAVIGQKFQILDVQDRTKRVNGGKEFEPVKNEDGTVQKQVLVRNTTQALAFTL